MDGGTMSSPWRQRTFRSTSGSEAETPSRSSRRPEAPVCRRRQRSTSSGRRRAFWTWRARRSFFSRGTSHMHSWGPFFYGSPCLGPLSRAACLPRVRSVLGFAARTSTFSERRVSSHLPCWPLGWSSWMPAASRGSTSERTTTTTISTGPLSAAAKRHRRRRRRWLGRSGRRGAERRAARPPRVVGLPLDNRAGEDPSSMGIALSCAEVPPKISSPTCRTLRWSF
mmetsp:Transcript_180381/g.572490  ORF Transcript_180381/g.572490 Transcript_180381/m.572490 type:complete len:225 (+) Transcript_180381:481-1155(+)